MPRSRRAHKDRSGPCSTAAGISYTEILVTLLLLALVVGGLLPLLTQGQGSYEQTRGRQEMVQNARVALDKMLREMRAAESFRSVSSSLVQFTLFWGNNTGEAPTVEYSLNGGTNDLEYRWKDNWDYRRQITVTAADAVAVDYAVPVTFDHAALVTAGKSLASGNDVRIRFWNGTKMMELDRFLDPMSAWNSTTTQVWFRLQTAMAAGATNANYYLHYGNLSAGSPPANADNIFLDYENGTTLDGWTRRDARPGMYGWSVSDGFTFTAVATNGFREQTKAVLNGDVEIFWQFRAQPGVANDGRQIGIGARICVAGEPGCFADGLGYRVTPGERRGGVNDRMRLRASSGWGSPGLVLQTFNGTANVVTGVDFWGRFYLVGTLLQAKIWQVGTAEPGWQISYTHPLIGFVPSGNHYGLVNGLDVPLDHRHRSVIVRLRVTNEPARSLGPEVPGTGTEALAALAGPFRSMSVICYDGAGATLACTSTTGVRSVEVALTVMDPTGRIPDITVTGRALRQSP